MIKKNLMPLSKLALLFGLLLGFASLFFVSCKKDEPTPQNIDTAALIAQNKIEVLMIGGAFDNKIISFGNFNPIKSQAGYNDTLQATTVTVMGMYNNENAILQFSFPDNKSGGVFEYEDLPQFLNNPATQFFMQIGQNQYYLRYSFLKITNYGQKLERLKGQFTAQLWDYNSNPDGKIVYLNQGIFDVAITF